MNLESIKASLLSSLQVEINLRKRGVNDYRIDVPFSFADGDAPKIILRETSDGSLLLTDEGHTSMYLSYHGIELHNNDFRASVLEKILLSHFMENHEGRLSMPGIRMEDVASALFTFTQGIMKVADMTLWKRERAQNMFMEKFRNAIAETIGKRQHNFDYHYPSMENYAVDCLITNTQGRHVHIYAAHTDTKANESMISMYHFITHSINAFYCAIFDSEVELAKKTRNKVLDVADKTISSLEAIPDALPRFLEKNENLA